MDHRQRLVEYIHECRKLMHDDVAIARRLLDEGWDQATVTEGFTIAGAPKKRRKALRLLPPKRLHVAAVLLVLIAAAVPLGLLHSDAHSATASIRLQNLAAIPATHDANGVLYGHISLIQLQLTCPHSYQCTSMSFSADGGKHYGHQEPFQKSKQWDLGEKDGSKTIDIKLYTANKQVLTEQLTAVLDRHPPTVTASAAVADAPGRTIRLSVDSSETVVCSYDQNVTSFQAMPANELMSKSNPLHYEKDIPGVPPGVATYHIACQDLAGNETQKSVSVTVPSSSVPTQQSVAVQAPKASMTPSSPLIEGTGICHSDSTQVPSLASVMLSFDAVCEANYSRILTLLNTNSVQPAPHYLNMVPKTQYGVAYANGNSVYLDQTWFTQHPDDNGAIVHELTHVVQSYYNAPGWLTEGIADYARYELGFASSWSYFHCDSSSRYDSGYSCTATFLKFVQTHYKASIVQDVHARLRAGTYSDQFFVNETGQTVDQLYQACLQADCKGGKQ